MWNNQIIEIVIVLTKRLLSMNCTLQNFVYLRFNLLPEVCLVHICNMLILILETINFLLEKNVKHSDHWNCDCVDETIAFYELHIMKICVSSACLCSLDLPVLPRRGMNMLHVCRRLLCLRSLDWARNQFQTWIEKSPG
jgi:hypothetical protein